jgi:peptidoglycan-associated lipoprotein
MLRRSAPIQWVIMAGLVSVLALGGCSRKNVIATTTGAEGQETAKSKSGAGGDRLAKSGGGPGDEGRGKAGAGGDAGAGGREKSFGSPGAGGESGGPGSGFKSTKPGTGESGESLGPMGSGPLQGFKKGSEGEERLGDKSLMAKAGPQDAESLKAREGRRRQLVDIYFEFDKWALSEKGKQNLADSAETLKQNPAAKLVIEGHCDERGSREYNLVLGEKRAKEARRYLADLGIQNPVSVTSFGKERPVCSEHDESCYWKNRRAHLLIDEGK